MNDERNRLKELENYHILDTPKEKIFDQITSLASAMCGTPIALVSLIDSERQWFKSAVGLDIGETPRNVSFCTHAILQDEVMEVSDSLLDSRFKDNPFVQGDPHIRFYAGAPLTSPRGYRLGTLCVIDMKPHTLTSEQKNGLMILARQVVDQLELRKLTLELTEAKRKLEDQQELLVNKARLQSIGELASGICHQINNPMAIIVGKSMVLKTLLREESGPKLNDMLKELESIDQTALRVSEILKTLRSYTKDMGHVMSECSLDDLVHDALILAKGRLQSADITLSYEFDSASTVKVNKNQVTHVILNLLTNAIEAMEGMKDKKITLKIWNDDKDVYLEVTDTGPGISENEKDKIFEPFFTTKTRHFGIGLSSASSFIEEHQGELIYLRNDKSIFRVRLPKAS